MILWLDAQLPPALAVWMTAQFGVRAAAVRDVNLRDATDEQIFIFRTPGKRDRHNQRQRFRRAGRAAGTAPADRWLTIGNTSNAALRELFAKTWPAAAELLKNGEPLLEIGG